jgi:hypothetical protein
MRIGSTMPDGQGSGSGALGSAMSAQQDATTGTRELAIAVLLGLTLWIAALVMLLPLY